MSGHQSRPALVGAPDVTPHAAAANLLQQRGYRTSERDLATAALARPKHETHTMRWNSRYLTNEQISTLGGEPTPQTRLSSPEPGAAAQAWSSAKAASPGGSGDSSSAGGSSRDNLFARPTAPVPVPEPLHPLEEAFVRLDRARRRRLEQLNARGIFSPQTNAARVDAALRAQLRRSLATHLGGESRSAARMRMGLAPLSGLRDSLAKPGADPNTPAARLGGAAAQDAGEQDAGGGGASQEPILKRSASVAAMGRRVTASSRRELLAAVGGRAPAAVAGGGGAARGGGQCGPRAGANHAPPVASGDGLRRSLSHPAKTMPIGASRGASSM